MAEIKSIFLMRRHANGKPVKTDFKLRVLIDIFPMLMQLLVENPVWFFVQNSLSYDGICDPVKTLMGCQLLFPSGPNFLFEVDYGA